MGDEVVDVPLMLRLAQLDFGFYVDFYSNVVNAVDGSIIVCLCLGL